MRECGKINILFLLHSERRRSVTHSQSVQYAHVSYLSHTNILFCILINLTPSRAGQNGRRRWSTRDYQEL